MKISEKATLKQAILDKISDLTKKVESFGELSKPVSPDNAIGRLTRMEAINSRSINEASLATAKQTLKALRKALHLIEDPDFGDCSHCEEPIPYKRLLIMPEASLCVSCAQKLSSNRL